MDLVVTVPKGFWFDWIAEGDAVGESATGIEWAFFLGRVRPSIEPGERLYIIAWGQLRGYAPVTRVAQHPDDGRWMICREGGAIACTLDHGGNGFQGFRKRWWSYDDELPFPEWRTAGVPVSELARARMRGVQVSL